MLNKFMKKYWLLALIVLAGLSLRIYHNLDISLWHDEAFSALMIRYSWGEMIRRLALDVHPPMYYMVLKLWHYAFGDGLGSLRGFSIFFGVLTIPAAYLFVKQAFFSHKMAMWAAILVAISPFEVQFAAEARMYTFGAFFTILAALFLVKALHEQKQYFEDKKLNMPNLPEDIKLKRRYIRHYAGFVICTAIISLTHYYLLFTAAALCLYALIYNAYHYKLAGKKYLTLLVSYIFIAILFLPQLKTFLWQLGSVTESYWIPDMTWWSIPSTVWAILTGFASDSSKPATQKLLILVILFSLYFLWRFIRKIDKFEKWLVLLAIIIPFLGSVLFYIKSITCAHTGVNGAMVCHGRSVYQERYFLYAAIFYTMALAIWLAEIKTKNLNIILLILYCGLNVSAIHNYWKGLNINNRPGMAAAANYLSQNVEPGQDIFVGTSFEFFNYKYYQSTINLTPARPLLYTGGRSDISQMSPVEGLPLLVNSDLAPTFEQYAHPGDTKWVIWTYAFGSNKPPVPSNWIAIDQQEFPDVRPYVGTSIYVTEYKIN